MRTKAEDQEKRVLLLEKVLDDVREAIEMQAADKSYNCGLGVSEWESFIDTVPLYKEWKKIKEVLQSE